MIFTSNDIYLEDLVISLPTGWTYLEGGRESEMAEELFDGTRYFDSLHATKLVEVFVAEGLLLW